MKNVLLFQLDGKYPNLALMHIAAHHRQLGDYVTLKHAGNMAAIERSLFDQPDQVYASLLFDRSRGIAERLQRIYPGAVIGGSGWDHIPDSSSGLISVTDRRANARVTRLEDYGITTTDKDWTIYPNFQHSLGFSQRG